MTRLQRERLVARAVKRMDAAAEALSDLQLMAQERAQELGYDPIDFCREGAFATDLKERAGYWEGSRWWK